VDSQPSLRLVEDRLEKIGREYERPIFIGSDSIESMQETGAAHLTAHDAVLAPLIQRFGPPPVWKHGNYYQELVESIISQQLSVKAGASITKRFVALFGSKFPTPAQILEKDVEALRATGISRPKAGYIRDLAQHVEDGTVKFDHLDGLGNEEIISELTAVKGIGEWTVHMFLIFCMGRSDVLAYGDLGVRNGIMKLYGFKALPDKAAVEKIAAANNWHPYESYACWYIWRSLDNEPNVVSQ